METKTTFLLAASALCLVPFFTTTACSSSDTSSSGGTGKTATAAVVSGAADSHCTATVTVDPAQCKGAAPAEDGGADAGEADGGEQGGSDFGDTMYGGEGDDDDCKYHIKWTAAPGKSAAAYSEVNFTAVITTKVDGKPLVGVPVDIEALDAQDKPPLNTDGETTEPTPGSYVVPVRFAPTASGKWTVRFHIHDDCNDTEESPHGHAAFFVQIDVK